MFDVGISEILLIGVVALVAVGPEDLPEMLFRLGRFIRQFKMFMGGVRDQYADIMHEAELQHYRKQIKAELLNEKTDELPKQIEAVKEETSDV